MINWDSLQRGDCINLAELQTHSEKGGCSHAKHNWHSNMPALCKRNKGHTGRHIAVNPEGVIIEIW